MLSYVLWFLLIPSMPVMSISLSLPALPHQSILPTAAVDVWNIQSESRINTPSHTTNIGNSRGSKPYKYTVQHKALVPSN